MLLPVVGSVRTSHNRVTLDPTDHTVACVAKIPEVVKSRYSEILLVARASSQRSGIETQSSRVYVVVQSNALREALVPQTAFQNLGWANRPGVVDSRQLRTRWSYRIPHVWIRGQRSHGLWYPRSGWLALNTVAKQVFNGDVMLRAENVVKLHMKVVQIQAVWRSHIQLTRGGGRNE